MKRQLLTQTTYRTKEAQMTHAHKNKNCHFSLASWKQEQERPK